MKDKISWYDFSCWGNEKIYVNEAIDSTWISGGEFVEKFENKLANLLNLPNAFVVSNGTAALQLAFLTLGVKPGDEVIVPSFGFLAAANVLKLMHATPIFVDVDEHHWCMKPEKITEKITKKTKAIVVIHNYGMVAEMAEISKLAFENNLYLIEDCAESIFSKYDNKYCGIFGDLSTFSFHATKTISTGEGGMVCCKDKNMADRLKLIRSHGLRRTNKHYWHEYYGNNFRMSNVLAAIGLGQLEKSSTIINNKKRVFKRYKTNLSKYPSIRFQTESTDSDTLYWAIAVYLDTEKIKISRDAIIQQMGESGIECRPGFYTPSQLDIYNNNKSTKNLIAEKLAKNILVLPSYPHLTSNQIDFISEKLKEAIGIL